MHVCGGGGGGAGGCPGMHRKGGEGGSRAPSLCPATVPLAASARAFVTDSNYPKPLWQPPPTADLTAAGTASEVSSLLMHPWGRGGNTGVWPCRTGPLMWSCTHPLKACDCRTHCPHSGGGGGGLGAAPPFGGCLSHADGPLPTRTWRRQGPAEGPVRRHRQRHVGRHWDAAPAVVVWAT